MDSPDPNSVDGSELTGLWQNLYEVNSLIGISEEQLLYFSRQQRIVRLYGTQGVDTSSNSLEYLGAQVTKLRVNLEEMEELRDSIRVTINEWVRPSLRSLTILDLPDELLMRIFDFTKGGYGDPTLYFFDWNGADVAQVKHLRLTCRRFCDTSSHLLLRCIKVSMTLTSIAHLEEVSRHPTISKGIRAINVILSYYDSVLATNFGTFAAYQATRLRSRIVSWQYEIDYPYELSSVPREAYENAITRALSIAESFEQVAKDGFCEAPAHLALLHRAHGRYEQHYDNQRIMQQETFVQAIALAMARMTKATWLEIYDLDDSPTRSEVLSTEILLPDLDEDEMLLDKLIAPLKNWEDARIHRLGLPPAEIIPRLISTLHEKDIPLTGLMINTPPPEDLSILLADNNENGNSKAAMKHLRALKISPQDVYTSDDFWTSREPGEWRPFYDFLSYLLSSTALQRIDLDVEFLYTSTLQPLVSMGTVLLSNSWPRLEELRFNGPFQIEELQHVVSRANKNLLLNWSGYLMNGSWAEVLECLKESISKDGISWYSQIGGFTKQVSGQEVEEMTDEDWNVIFKEKHPIGSLATNYIRGLEESNPIRVWEHGDLVV